MSSLSNYSQLFPRHLAIQIYEICKNCISRNYENIASEPEVGHRRRNSKSEAKSESQFSVLTCLINLKMRNVTGD